MSQPTMQTKKLEVEEFVRLQYTNTSANTVDKNFLASLYNIISTVWDPYYARRHYFC